MRWDYCTMRTVCYRKNGLHVNAVMYMKNPFLFPRVKKRFRRMRKASTVRITHTDLTEKRMMFLPSSHTTAKPLENKITRVRSEDQRKQEARRFFSSFFYFHFFELVSSINPSPIHASVERDPHQRYVLKPKRRN